MSVRVRRQVKSKLGEYQRVRDHYFGQITEVGGVTTVPGTKRYCYMSVPGRGVFVVMNKVTPHQAGLNVRIGYSDQEPDTPQVMGVLAVPGLEHNNNADVGPHAPNHQWGGSDVPYFDTRQLTQANVYPKTGLIAAINPGYMRHFSGYVLVKPALIDLTSHVPGSDGR